MYKGPRFKWEWGQAPVCLFPRSFEEIPVINSEKEVLAFLDCYRSLRCWLSSPDLHLGSQLTPSPFYMIFQQHDCSIYGGL